MKHGNFALFLPTQGCPYTCVYCDQNKITGQKKVDLSRMEVTLREGARGWREDGRRGQIAFFGGTFTGLAPEEMRALLLLAQPYLADGTFDGIRISTRPDRIDARTLSLLREYGVTHIELGVQSMCDDVLRASGRGYDAGTVETGARMIRDGGFVLGMQMMTGLPCDTPEKSLFTARRLIEMGAAESRIYPTVVLRGTALARAYEKGEYLPPSLEETVALCAELADVLERAEVTILKMGLHGDLRREDIVAGPFHPAFRQLVDGKRCLDRMISFSEQHAGIKTLYAVPRKFGVSDIVGHHGVNRKTLLRRFGVRLEISGILLTSGVPYVIL